MTEHNLNYSSFLPLPCFELPFLFLLFLPLIFLCHLKFHLKSSFSFSSLRSPSFVTLKSIYYLPFPSPPYVNPPLSLVIPTKLLLTTSLYRSTYVKESISGHSLTATPSPPLRLLPQPRPRPLVLPKTSKNSGPLSLLERPLMF